MLERNDLPPRLAINARSKILLYLFLSPPSVTRSFHSTINHQRIVNVTSTSPFLPQPVFSRFTKFQDSRLLRVAGVLEAANLDGAFEELLAITIDLVPTTEICQLWRDDGQIQRLFTGSTQLLISKSTKPSSLPQAFGLATSKVAASAASFVVSHLASPTHLHSSESFR